MNIYLKGLKGKYTDKEVQIEGARLTIGREVDNHFVLDEETMSAHHAEIVKKDDLWVVRDLGSSNGTFLNGKGVKEEIVRNGDIISFDLIEFQFVDPSQVKRTEIRKTVPVDEKPKPKKTEIRRAPEAQKVQQGREEDAPGEGPFTFGKEKVEPAKAEKPVVLQPQPQAPSAAPAQEAILSETKLDRLLDSKFKKQDNSTTTILTILHTLGWPLVGLSLGALINIVTIIFWVRGNKRAKQSTRNGRIVTAIVSIVVGLIPLLDLEGTALQMYRKHGANMSLDSLKTLLVVIGIASIAIGGGSLIDFLVKKNQVKI